MIDWEEVIRAKDGDKLREVKLWLFQENIRLENERRELEQSQEKFLNERVRLRNELDELNRRTLLERKRLKEENLFFDKKMAILQDGFRKLDEDRQSLERQKKALAQAKTGYDRGGGDGTVMEETVRLLFGVPTIPLPYASVTGICLKFSTRTICSGMRSWCR